MCLRMLLLPHNLLLLLPHLLPADLEHWEEMTGDELEVLARRLSDDFACEGHHVNVTLFGCLYS